MEIKKLGRYEILAEIGQGAMGLVYKAIDPLIDRTVAIKTINLNLSKDELSDFEERFNREAKSAGRLNHPNIVTIYDVGRADHVAFITMEYLEGRELKEIIASGEPLSPERVVEIVSQVADALAFAHEHGVVHRDIKPANIMVLRNGNVKITDFGIAKMSSGSRTQIGIILGSPKYMSPEQIAGKDIDGRSDIFSLGGVLYELLTGKNAFGGEDSTLTSIMFQILNEMPVLPSKVNPLLSSAFDNIVARALAKAPENRYQSAREMAAALRDIKNLTTTPSPVIKKKQVRKMNPKGGDTLVLDANEINDSLKWTGKRKWLITSTSVLAITIAAIFFSVSQKHTTKSVTTDIPTPAMVAVAPPPEPVPSTHVVAERDVPKERSKTQVTPKATAPAMASLNLAILPWGEVFIDGKSQGASPPLKTVNLTQGSHLIEIKNTNFPVYRQTVKIRAGTTQKIQHKFK